jgi:hypothetical protein
LLLLFVSIALANSELQNWAQGKFSCTSVEEVSRQRDVALQEALDATNIVVRTVVESKLTGSPHICANYLFATSTDTMTVTCDDRPVIDIKLDGTATIYPKGDGSTFQSVALVKGNQIIQTLQGENGQLQVVYVFSEGGVVVTKKISSPYLGKSIEVVIPYDQSRKH